MKNVITIQSDRNIHHSKPLTETKEKYALGRQRS